VSAAQFSENYVFVIIVIPSVSLVPPPSSAYIDFSFSRVSGLVGTSRMRSACAYRYWRVGNWNKLFLVTCRSESVVDSCANGSIDHSSVQTHSDRMITDIGITFVICIATSEYRRCLWSCILDSRTQNRDTSTVHQALLINSLTDAFSKKHFYFVFYDCTILSSFNAGQHPARL